MADDGASSQIPPTLSRAAGITWRVLILLAGLVVVGFFLNLFCDVHITIVTHWLLSFPTWIVCFSLGTICNQLSSNPTPNPNKFTSSSFWC